MGKATYAETKESTGLNQAAMSVIDRYGGERGQHVLALAAAVQVAAPGIKWVVERLRRNAGYTITVTGTDGIYPDLHEWVLARIPELERKSLMAHTTMGEYRSAPGKRTTPRIRLRYDGSREQQLVLDGHKVTVAVQREEVPRGGSIEENWRELLEKITFTTSSVGGRDAIVKVIEQLVEERENETGPPALMIPARWGAQWINRGDLPPRTLESVVLKEGQLERLVDDLEEFLESEEQYDKRYLPWHRGYLLYGEPGTGKTSVARALANHFGMPIYDLPLGELDKDADLLSLVTQVPARSVLLLEDIDVFSAATTRTDEKGKTTIQAMLNALDGLWTPHGLVTIMTTNDRDALDPALIRKGRIDVEEEFTVLDDDQATRLARWYTGHTLTTAASATGRSPSEYVETLRSFPQEVAA